MRGKLPNQNLLNDSVYVGFSASTGTATEDHIIKKWYFSNSPASGGIDPVSGSYTQAVSTVSVSPSSATNPSTATVQLYDASGSAMSGTADIYVDGICKITGASVTTTGYDYSIPSGLSVGSHTVQAVATGGASDDAGFSVSSPAVSLGSATLSSDGKYYYENATVTGDNIRTMLLSFSGNVTSGDAITLPAAAGFTVSGTSNAYTKRINISDGTLTSAIQNYLREVGFAIVSPTQTVNVTVTTENITTDTFYNIDTQHYYQYISAGAGPVGHNMDRRLCCCPSKDLYGQNRLSGDRHEQERGYLPEFSVRQKSRLAGRHDSDKQRYPCGCGKSRGLRRAVLQQL